jgi:hypothetical protein
MWDTQEKSLRRKLEKNDDLPEKAENAYDTKNRKIAGKKYLGEQEMEVGSDAQTSKVGLLGQ